MLEDDHTMISKATQEVQQVLNETAGIGIKAQSAPLDQDRVEGILNRVCAADQYDEVAWVLDEPVKTFSRSVVDDTLKANVDFQGRAGLAPKIIRRAENHCCEWCNKLEGVYTYPDVPKDIYRRHERCRCIVEYDPGSGKRQNVHTKGWTEPDQRETIEKRKLIGLSEKTSRDQILEKVRTLGLSDYEKALVNEEEITSAVKKVGESVGLNPYGLENRIKSKRRYLEKLENNIESGKKEINDVLRYTLGTDNPRMLIKKMNQAFDSFSKLGYNTVVLKNTWVDHNNPYKGINSVVVAPNGQKFEVQYHTKESFEIKERMHGLYEKARRIDDKNSEQYLALQDEMIEMSKALTIPDGIERIESYGK